MPFKAKPNPTKMEKFITLNSKEGPITINIQHIVYFYPYGDGSAVKLVGDIGLTIVQNTSVIEALIARANQE